jgi:hypothetical protein
MEGLSYEEMAVELGCDTKTIDNALQRVKRKVLTHQQSRQVLSSARGQGEPGPDEGWRSDVSRFAPRKMRRIFLGTKPE